MSTSDRPNILWISIEDTTPSLRLSTGTHLRVRRISTGLLLVDVGSRMRFRPLGSVRRVVPQSSPVCIRLRSVRTTCERHIQMRTHQRCRPRIPQSRRLTSKPLPNTSEGQVTIARTIARPTISLHHLSPHGMCVITPGIGETVKPDNPSFRFSIRLLHTKVECGNGRIVP